MEECIPRKVLPQRQKNLPWLAKRIIQAMRYRNKCYKWAKSSTVYQQKYRKARNKVVSMLRSSQKDNFRKLDPNQSKPFWKTMRAINNCPTSVPVLYHGTELLSSDQEMVKALSTFFSQCFNYNVPSLFPSHYEQTYSVMKIFSALWRKFTVC